MSMDEASTTDVYLRVLSSEEALDQESYAMLRRNELTNVLSPVFVQKDDERILRYDVPDMHEAQVYLSAHVFNRVQYVGILLGVTNAFIELGEYMLPQNGLIADFEHVYVDNRLNIHMPYIPIEGIEGNDGPIATLRAAERLLEPDKDSGDLDYVATVQEALTQWNDFTPLKFKKLLAALTLKPSANEVKARTRREKDDAKQKQTAQGSNVNVPPVDIASSTGPTSGLTFDGMNIPGVGTHDDSADMNQGEVQKRERGGFFSGILKKKHRDAEALPAEQDNADVGFAVPGAEDEFVPGVSSTPKDERSERIGSGLKAAYTRPDDGEETEVVGHETKLRQQKEEERTPSTDYTGKAGVTIRAYLMRERTGEQRLISVTPFHIGRRQSEVDFYVSGNSMVGRIHATITFDRGVFYIIDNDSTNHTFLNGRQLEPRMPTPLSEQDLIELSKTERFRFFES